MVFDIENQKCVELQIVHIDRGYRMELERHHISEIAATDSTMDEWYYEFLKWSEQNLPAVISEIRTFNQSEQPAPMTDVARASNTPTDTETIPDVPANYSAGQGGIDFVPFGYKKG